MVFKKHPAALVEKAMVFKAQLNAALVAYALAQLVLRHAAIRRHAYPGAHLVDVSVCIVGFAGFVEGFRRIQQYFAVAEDGAGVAWRVWVFEGNVV